MTFREITYEAIVLRILAAIIVGGLIGLERGMKNRPAGLRTYMLVCVDDCLFTKEQVHQEDWLQISNNTKLFLSTI